MTPENVERLKKIKILILDVDGIMTDGRIYWIKDQGWTRDFYVPDGVGIIGLRKLGIPVAIISAGESEDVIARMKRLHIEDYFLGQEDKLKVFKKLLHDKDIDPNEVAYMGDEWTDIPVLKEVGFAATVPQADKRVKKVSHYETTVSGGRGAVREVVDAIVAAQNKSLGKAYE